MTAPAPRAPTPSRPRGIAPAFAPDPRRRAMLAKVAIARKELGLDEEDYRAILLDVTGKRSAGECDERQLTRLLERFKQRGFTPKSGAAAGRARQADHPSARKARALWISLHQLGVIENASEAALEAFAKRQLKCERLQWADGALLYKLIEALKAMAARNGWDQNLANLPPSDHARELVSRLVDAQWRKLEAAGRVSSAHGYPPIGLRTRASIERLRACADHLAAVLHGADFDPARLAGSPQSDALRDGLA